MIEFLCPNGHLIHCTEDQAGRAARCPQCGVRFRVPDPAQAEPEAASAPGGVLPPPRAAPVPPLPSSVRRGPPSGEQIIEFLCPNGHRLHGPASLQGRPGECPECGCRFRVPSYEKVAEDEPLGEGISAGRADRRRDSSETVFEAASHGGASALGSARDTAGSKVAPDVPRSTGPTVPDSAARPAPNVPRHPLAVVVSRLWPAKPPGAAVELHLRSGEVVAVEEHVTQDWQLPYAAFAVRQPDGKFRLIVLPWDVVERVVIGGVEKLPDSSAR